MYRIETFTNRSGYLCHTQLASSKEAAIRLADGIAADSPHVYATVTTDSGLLVYSNGPKIEGLPNG